MTSSCSRCDKPFQREPIKCAVHKGYICMDCVGYVDREGHYYCWDCIEIGQKYDEFKENEINVL